MTVTLKLFASLRKSKKRDILNLECPVNFTVNQLLQGQEISATDAPVILVNGIRVAHSHVLHDGDVVSAFPLIGGG